MSQLEIRLLGGFQVSINRSSLSAFETDKARALLAYLAVEVVRSHRREAIAAIFWPERPVVQARNNLRQTLYRLRHAIDDYQVATPYLLTSDHSIQIDPAADYWLDVAEFCSHVDVWQTHHPSRDSLCERCQQLLEMANGLYQGDFLAGFSLPGNQEFELWQFTMQEAYHRKVLDVLAALGDYYEEAQAYGQAADCAEKAISLEPWMESAHRRQMRALALSGQRSATMAHYDRCRYLLAQEMNTTPSARTTQLHEQIRDRKLITEG